MIEEELKKSGFTDRQVAAIIDVVDAELDARALPRMVEVLHRIFLRVDRDSITGRALSRALGFTSDQSLGRAARDFGVSKQYLHKVQSELEIKLRDVAGPGPAGR